jgi:nitroreductase
MSELHPLLSARWSPRAFDPLATLADAELASLLEAARWAPSAANSQPWRFMVGRRDHEAYKLIFNNLAERNQRWAGRASALLLGAHATVSATGEPLSHGAYDLGQSMAHLTVQASALGLYAHQMVDFDPAGIRVDLDLPDDVTPLVVVAIGRLGDPSLLPPDLRRQETALRVRRPVAELLR